MPIKRGKSDVHWLEIQVYYNTANINTTATGDRNQPILYWYNSTHVQLPTGETLHKHDDLCPYSCNAIEDMHHLFIECKHYDEWRTQAADKITERTEGRLSESDVEESIKNTLLSIAKSLFKTTIDGLSIILSPI